MSKIIKLSVLVVLCLAISILFWRPATADDSLREFYRSLYESQGSQIEQRLRQLDVEILEAKAEGKLTPEFYDNIISRAQVLLSQTLNETSQLVIREAIANYRIQRNNLIPTQKNQNQQIKNTQSLPASKTIDKDRETSPNIVLPIELDKNTSAKINPPLYRKILNVLIRAGNSVKNFIRGFID